MRTMMLSGLAMLFISLCFGQEIYQNKRVQKLWETQAVFKVPESVLFDPERGIIFVANINGTPLGKDGNGFLSKLSGDGKILELEWIKGLNAPKGMGVWENRLFVTDIDRVVEVDLDSNTVRTSYPAANAQFLNDIAIDHAGNVYVSDMTGGVIYILEGGKLDLWLKSDALQNPNGLFVEGDYLLIGIKDSVLRVHLRTKEITTYIRDTGGIDGLESDGQGNYVISDWAGTIHLIHPEKEKVKLLDTTPANINAADIDFIVGDRILLVPTFSDNRIMAYKVN